MFTFCDVFPETKKKETKLSRMRIMGWKSSLKFLAAAKVSKAAVNEWDYLNFPIFN